ncbi:AfsR/SARP family transcriptional regulator [Streptosporangium sp. DT93]|uniref:AfsR/SARP family transcriptional regulator n=1 Tax=Streptosporangium sp. DT93 TaxID=3393428 RepID=UPI003CE6779E
MLRVLGPLQAEIDGRAVDLGTSRQRAVVARLVAAGGHVVSTDRFIDDLWRGQPPPKALTALQVYVSNLRRVLEPGRAPRTPATVLVGSRPGNPAGTTTGCSGTACAPRARSRWATGRWPSGATASCSPGTGSRTECTPVRSPWDRSP